ncbi:uncharacterized protein LOC114882479 [Osmia bicornis bicornis]|uniref:uncharacterized protein LOC114882479 n=1 Tax=Osmia bicornis bicornis TaxID=1437191 RepID=UPI0010F47014|nr:uncharacterized protein LOC114882479 [Osmia bicornis bicornis]
MVSSVLLFNLILLLKIILQTECKSLETTPQSSDVTDIDTEFLMHIISNINDTELNTTKNEVNSTINLGEPFELTIETRPKREPSAMNAVNSTDTNQTSSRLEETLQEMFLEPWGRIRRDADDAQDQNSDETAQDGNSNESAQTKNSDEGQSDYNDTDEDNDPSHESSIQLEHDGTSSMQEEVREKRNGESGESLEEGTTLPSLHQVNLSKDN